MTEQTKQSALGDELLCKLKLQAPSPVHTPKTKTWQPRHNQFALVIMPWCLSLACNFVHTCQSIMPKTSTTGILKHQRNKPNLHLVNFNVWPHVSKSTRCSTC